MNKAVFLDRDGVINTDTGYVHKPADFHFVNGIFEFCRIMQSRGYLLIVVTNQAGIARGYYTESDFLELNDWMVEQFARQDIRITKTYYCPYHPEHGIGEYRLDSPDRKPDPGMILKACEEFDIDLSRSIMIGDKDDDMRAGYRAGIGNLFFLSGRYKNTETGFPYGIYDDFDGILAGMDGKVNENQQQSINKSTITPERKINVLVIGSVYPRFPEDVEVPWLRATVREMKKNNCGVTVVAPSHKGLKQTSKQNTHVIDGTTVHRFRYAPRNFEILTHDEGAPSKIARNPLLQLLAIPYIISGSIKTLRLSLKLKPDILHVHWPFPHAFMALFAKFFRRTPVVLNFHGAELLLAQRKKWIRPILRMFIKKADAIAANSSFTVGKVKEIYDRDVTMLPGTTMETSTLASAPAQPRPSAGKFRVLFVGRHIERKGIEYLIKAAALLDPEKFEVRIVGGGDLTGKLQKLAEAEASRQVIFLGKLSKEDLKTEYETAGCFVLPAIIDSRGDTEGLGAVLIEAAEYGVPIVASDVGGIPDVVINNETGLLVKEKSPQELAKALQKLSGDETLCAKLVENCRKRVNDFFSWDRFMANQIELYRSLVE